MASPTQPLKQYEVIQPGTFHTSKFETRQNGQTILNTKRQDRVLRAPYIHIMSTDGKILATCMLQTMSRKQHLYLGSNPDHADKSECTLLDCEGFTASNYTFQFQGKSLAWTRTHAKELGAPRFAQRDFKLVDQGTKQVLVVHRFNNAMFKHGRLAEIDFYVELGQELELMSLAAILGIELHIVRKGQAGAGAGAGGGA